MDYAALRNEILAGPRAADCAPFVILPSDPKVDGATAAWRDAQIAALLSETKPGAVKVVSRFLVDMDILREWDGEAGSEFLEKLATVAQGSALVRRCLHRLENSRGLDFGDAQVRATMQALVGTAGITQTEVDAVLALCEAPATWAEDAGISNPTGADVSIALRGGNDYTLEA